VRFKRKFSRPVPLSELRAQKTLQKMVLLRKGSRLSIQPVTPTEFETVCDLGARRNKRD
jgi:predicted RNA-binding protein with PUA-like domain